MDTEIATPLALFTSTCEALHVPAGAQRLDAFLRLPNWQQEAILVEVNAEATSQAEIMRTAA